MEGETLIAMARRHVQEGSAHIAKQRALIDRLAKNDQPTKAAWHLLGDFEDQQARHPRHLDQIVQQQQNGERDADGSLIRGAPLA